VTSKIIYDPKTKTYSYQMTIGKKEPIPAKKMRGAMSKAILGLLARWQELQVKELTDVLFWFEEGWI